MNNDEMITVNEIIDICKVPRGTVTRWIRNGYIPATKKNPDKDNSRYLVKAADFQKFLNSDQYHGFPMDITKNGIFNRKLDLEDCWPYNCLIGVLKVKLDSEEGPTDIFEYDIRGFKTLITYLSERDQQVLRMRYINGMTLDEIGKIFGLTRERIRTIQFTAERKLRRWIHDKKCKVVPLKKYNELLYKNEALMLEVERLNRCLVGKNYDIKNFSELEKEAADASINVPFYNLDLSVRAFNCLGRYGEFKTIKDLIEFDKNQDKSGKTWYDIRNLGRRSLNEVAVKVFNYCHYKIHDYNKKTGQYTEMDIPTEAK